MFEVFTSVDAALDNSPSYSTPGERMQLRRAGYGADTLRELLDHGKRNLQRAILQQVGQSLSSLFESISMVCAYLKTRFFTGQQFGQEGHEFVEAIIEPQANFLFALIRTSPIQDATLK